jgi:hypothetical protein
MSSEDAEAERQKKVAAARLAANLAVGESKAKLLVLAVHAARDQMAYEAETATGSIDAKMALIRAIDDPFARVLTAGMAAAAVAVAFDLAERITLKHEREMAALAERITRLEQASAEVGALGSALGEVIKVFGDDPEAFVAKLVAEVRSQISAEQPWPERFSAAVVGRAAIAPRYMVGVDPAAGADATVVLEQTDGEAVRVVATRGVAPPIRYAIKVGEEGGQPRARGVVLCQLNDGKCILPSGHDGMCRFA